ncbi:TPR Domain containing protein [Trichomonas vaginalis G3]|uniref:TPR Domain containing protein n=1 Tax=Trichomonas vaginalis (strain ATCC PRA-98 / G3) TaxID=412133 RepID=A2DQN7_TRIV3|nr:DNAJ-like protein subfamily C member 7 family [Trichomonas vaginalis G3]EAY17321.1 TPR Domain containing protein [Trichomonas vaginalis G3]KAI5515667.1 DNAJ-like protein subfamily C member 7 family [Trichomonas vaginalis G3]|eukprot:XP_001329544.1 TPR Domain containing protein [Trichomonas vaginalis G3]
MNDYKRFVEQGNTFCYQREYSKAIAAYTSAIQLNPHPSALAIIYENRAYCYIKLEMLHKAKADMLAAQDMNAANFITPTTQVSEIYEDSFFHKTYVPPKIQNAFMHLQHLASLHYLTTNSEKIDESDENKKNILTIRGDAFAESQQYKEAVLDYTNARKYNDDPNFLASLAYFAVLSNQTELAQETIKQCKEKNVQCHLAEGVLDLINFKYKSAYEHFDQLDGVNDAYKYKTYIHYAFGNVSKAYSCSRNCFSQDGIFVYTQHCLRIITSNDLPSYFNGKNGSYTLANFLIAGIYKSLASPIEEVPVDLYIPHDVLMNPNTFADLSLPEAKFPDNFVDSATEQSEVDLLIRIAAKIHISAAPGKRERVCCGLALIQVVQMLLSQKVTLATCVAQICHWLRLSDPTSFLDYRKNEPLKIFLHNGSFDTVLDCYSSSVFNFLKNRLQKPFGSTLPLRQGQKDLGTAMESAECPDDLSDIFKNQIDISVSETVSIFYSRDIYGYNFGLSVQPPSPSMMMNLDVIWCGLLSMISSRNVSKESTAKFVEKATEFLFSWMFSSPLMTMNDVVGAILFRALMWAFFGADVIKETPEPIVMHVDAVLTNFAPLYQMYMLPHIKISSEGQTVDRLPSVLQAFPSYVHRIRSLLNIGSEEIPETFDFRKAIQPVYCTGPLGSAMDI